MAEQLKDHVGVATWIESFYWTNDRYPTLEETKEFSGWTANELALIAEPINKQLAQRGHPPRSFKEAVRKTKRELDPKFVAACVVICDPNNKASLAAKLKLAGLKTSEWQVLLNDPLNKKYFQTRIAKVFKNAEESAQLSLVKNIESADLQSIKYYHEMTGIYRPNAETLLNIGVLLSQLMEILATYIPQTQLLEIAEKFEKVVGAHSEDEPPEVKELFRKNPLLEDIAL